MPLSLNTQNAPEVIDVPDLLALASSAGLGIFWPTLKVHFDRPFANKFLVAVLVVATLNCFALSGSFGWWVLLIYPIAYLAGAALSNWFAQGPRLRFFLLGGGIWLTGLTAAALAVAAAVLYYVSV